MIPFTLTQDSLSVVVDGRPRTFAKGTAQFGALRAAIVAEQWDAIPTMLTASGALDQYLKGTAFFVENNALRYGTEALSTEVPPSLTARIQRAVADGADPSPFLRFYERLDRNPSFRSRTQLFDFLQHADITIDANGMLVTYKGVDGNLMDEHTHTIDNSPGATNEMPRNRISDDPEVACHYGFHVGSLSYASGFAARVVICWVDPEHVVCVPRDASQRKMRVCRYQVVGHWNGHGSVGAPESDRWVAATGAAGMSSRYPELDDEDEDEDDEGYSDEEAARRTEELEEDIARQKRIDHAVEMGKQQTTLSYREPKVAVRVKPAVGTVAKFGRLTARQLMERTIDELRLYAGKLKIVGATKVPGGKSALVSVILKARKRGPK